ncbi:probable ATP-dependent RNA helicase DHX37 [Watersipora subatra]|uniref:probable ATP-dependent RNA helicase DHX37 n=1 Tax=Watersipora subatra TaxID=2589382 RepID=UPI00355C02BF
MMGKRKRGFNSAARVNSQVTIDNSSLSQLKVDESIIQENVCSDDTPLILPSKKRKTTKLKEPGPVRKVLSKKERRKLESIVDRKKKKEKRSELLEALKKVQIPASELKFMSSTQDMHHRKSKKSQAKKAKVASDTPIYEAVPNSIKGSNRISRGFQVVEQDSESSDCDITSEEEEAEEEDGEQVAEQEDISEATCNDQECVVTSDSSAPPECANKSIECSDSVVSKESKSDLGHSTHPSLLSQLKGGVAVQRDQDIQISRMKLPILGEEQQIIETISENQVTIICGETGSGKTTQVPQFLYEAGYTGDGYMIGITEPRRVAAISMSKRVARELNLTEGQVSYQIRYEGNVTPDTCIKFMTDGVLLKEIQNNFMLDKYRAIIIDEAHERSVYTDVLIGLLTRIVSLRHKRGKPLKMIIMSATLRVEDFRENKALFPVPPPVLKVDSRQYPVTIHFNKRTEDDYLTETFRKICKIHRQLPPGGILVFVTGKQEIHTLCRRLQRTFPSRSKPSSCTTSVREGQSAGVSEEKPEMAAESVPSTHSETKEATTAAEKKEEQVTDQPLNLAALDEQLPNIKLDSYSALPMDEQAELEPEDSDMDSGSEDEEEEEETLPADKVFDYEQKRADSLLPLHVLPLYSLLNPKKQAQVFEAPPEGCRLCVISTNVAETSLTIPNIKYVIDCGRTKNKFYDKVTGVSTFRVTFTSQASANQRAGRAGRTGPGHCYRLYSSSVFNNEFDKFSEPEIVSRPVDDLVLLMNAMGIERVVNFPFPTPPSHESLLSAHNLLIKLGAVETTKKIKGQHPATRITSLGKVMSLFPVAPRYARILSMAHQKGLLKYVIALVAACSVQELFMEGSLSESENTPGFAQQLQKQKLQWAGKGESLLLGDLMVLLKAVGTVEYAGCSPSYCDQLGIRYKAILEIRKLRVQLTNIVNSVIPSARVSVDPKMKPPTEKQVKLIRQMMLVGLSDHIARLNVVANDAEPDVKKRMRNSYQCTLIDDYCYIHPNSVLNKKHCEYIIYQDIVDANNKIYLRGVTAIEPEWIPKYADSRCTFSEPLESPEPRFDGSSGIVVCHLSSTFGPHSWMLPKVEMPYPNKIEKYRWFAKAILEGLVMKKMKPLVAKYLASPSIMLKSWARLQPRTEAILQALYGKKICTRDSLKAQWAADPSFLLEEVMQWLPSSEHSTVSSMWPPLKHSVETET